MAEIPWIKIKTDIFDDEKILLLESMPDGYALVTVWIKLLCFAGKQNNSGVFMMGNITPYNDKMLATIFRMKESTVSLALQTFEQFGMIETIDGVITIPNWDKHQSLDAYEKKKERDRLYQTDRRAKQKALITQSSEKSSDNRATPSSDVAVLDIEEDIEEDIDIHTLCKSSPSNAELKAFFDNIWKLYPNKKGKGQVSESRKKALYDIGLDEMTRAIKRYKQGLEQDKWRKAQNGSTFFNSGYVDYLDINYNEEDNSGADGYEGCFGVDL